MIDPMTVNWVSAFLTGRPQSVVINNSPYLISVTSRVLLGSVLGPVLFLICTNELPSSITSTIKLFEDGSET